MKLGPYLLINLLMVGGGIFIYDSLKGDAGTSSQTPVYDPLSAEATDSTEPAPAPPPMELDGGANELRQRDNVKRIKALETAFRHMRQDLERRGSGNAGGSTSSSPNLPSMARQDVVDTENPVFDENTLDTIAAYQEEINRRKNEERQMMRITTELDRKGIELNETQRESVVKETLAYQTKARELLRKKFSADQAGREERQQAFKGLQEEYASVVNSLVPEEQAEKILESRLGRGMGFFGNFGGGNRGGQGRRKR